MSETVSRACALAGLLLVVFRAPAGAEGVNPYPRPVVSQTTEVEWAFDGSECGWTAQNQCRIEPTEGTLRITSTGVDPYLRSPPVEILPRVQVVFRMRSSAGGSGQIFWAEAGREAMAEERSRRFRVEDDGEWHEYSVELSTSGALHRIRLDPGSKEGTVELDWMRIERVVLHPLELERVSVGEDSIDVTVRSHVGEEVRCELDGRSFTVPARGSRNVSLRLERESRKPFEPIPVTVEMDGLPDVSRPLVVVRPEVASEWITLQKDGITLEVAPDGSGAKVHREGTLVATLAPLVWSRGRVPVLGVKRRGGSIWAAGGVVESLELAVDSGHVYYRLRAREVVEGPVVRAIGTLEQGLLAGVEHLGRGESSSSDVDIEGPEHVRYAPDPMDVTMPLMAVVTDVGSAALSWDDMALQPVFAAPNFFDGASDHRMALRGREVDVTIRVGKSFGEGERIEDAILWTVRRRGLPALPPPVRSEDAQAELSLRALRESVVADPDGGWYHAVVPGHRKMPDEAAPLGDCVATLFRLTGTVPPVADLVHGGGHISDDGAYFLGGRAGEWREMMARRARGSIRAQQPDGSYGYRGEFARGHFEMTASGLCARHAWLLLEHAWMTGDAESLESGTRTLEYMRRFRTPRGAQIWECPLHAPDLLASAHLVRAYVRGYELTSKKEYLDLAVRWALSGVPFVYQWANRPIMVYATTPTLCATHYRAPVWIGLPVQWVGLVYADALVDLLPHDSTLDWGTLARGILLAGEAMQYPDGPSVGCLPDVFELRRQERRPADINPCALVALRLRLDGKPQGLSVATGGAHRVVAPFPVTIEGDVARVRARAGVRYQVLVDAARVVDVASTGVDEVVLIDR